MSPRMAGRTRLGAVTAILFLVLLAAVVGGAETIR